MTSTGKTDAAFLPAADLVAHYRKKRLSPVEVTKAVLARIEQFNSIVNAYCHIDAAGALEEARASEARWMAGRPAGLVDGVPLGVKDNILAAGMPARSGSKLTRAERQSADAPAVQRLREHGAILIGKTATPEFGWKAVTDSPLTGITRNPWDTRMTPGGSSGGAAAAVVLGMGQIHLGTDGGGSIRIPAAFTGCYGIKPTRGRVPVWPASPLGTLAHVGPLTRTVADAALVLTTIAAPDARDVHGWMSSPPDFRLGLEEGVRGLRIAYSPRLGYCGRIDAEIEAAVAAAVETFADLGAEIECVDPDIGGDPIAAWETLWWSAAATVLQPFGERAGELADPGLMAGAAAGVKISAIDHNRAQLKRAELHGAFARFHEQFDLLLTPAVPLPAFEAGHLVPPSGQWGKAWWEWSPFSYPFNLTQQPAASVPCGATHAGLPIGLQIVGPIGGDGVVLKASRAFEATRGIPALDAPRQPTEPTAACF